MCTATDINSYLKTQLGKENTTFKRQKLLYYAQGWYLGWYGHPIFDDEIRAWEMGPVIPSVWKDEERALKKESAALNSEIIAHIESIISFYGYMTGRELIARTHSEEPWLNAWDRLHPNNLITQASIFEYFSGGNIPAPQKPLSTGIAADSELVKNINQSVAARLAGVDRLLVDR